MTLAEGARESTVPLVLLSGMGCSERLWDGVRRLLPETETLSPALDRPDLDDVVDGLLERLPSRFALAGLSLGGIVAMALARRAPERLSRLCLISTNARPPTPQQRDAWTIQLADLAAGRSARDLQTDLLPFLLRPDALPPLRETTLTMADEVGEAHLADQLRLQGTRVDERPGLRGVAVPTLVVAAAEDALCPVERHEEIRDLIPGSSLVVLPETGHLSALERPAEVAAALRTWLADG
jgi:pimeloyl-ACP methyl ester carboxylesterase